MKRGVVPIIGLVVLGAASASVAWDHTKKSAAHAGAMQKSGASMAVAVLQPKSGSQVNGTVTFVQEGSQVVVAGDSDYTVLATRTTGAEPPGVVRIQYPADAGWDLDSMAAFLASVHVGPGARHGHG